MSCIAAKVYTDKIIMCSDSIAITGDNLKTSTCSKIAPKMIQYKDFVIGSTGYSEDMMFLQIYLESHTPESVDNIGMTKFLIDFNNWVKNEVNSEIKSHYLIIYQKKLFYCESRFASEIDNYYAIGAGKSYAIAALHLGHTVEEAVQVACDLCTDVSGPIKTITVDLK